jgi:exopolysaccharide biosynthesis polyprenyl glycosylphosphotransferase
VARRLRAIPAVDLKAAFEASVVAQEQLGVPLRLERRRAARWTVSHGMLRLGFGICEAALAIVAVLGPTLFYHLVVEQAPLADLRWALYGAYAAIAGLVYGGFSAAAAGRLLEDGRQQQSAIAEGTLGWTGAFAVALMAAFLAGCAGELSRVSMISAYVVGVPLLIGGRSIVHGLVSSFIRAGRLQYRKAGVIGNRGDVVRFLFNGSLWRAGYQLAGTLYLEDLQRADGSFEEAAVGEAAQRWISRGAGSIVLVDSFENIDEIERLGNDLKRFSVSVACAPATDNTSFKFLDVVPLGANNAVRFLRQPLSDGAVLLKRLFDLCGALCGLLLLSPLFLVVALLIKLDNRGPVFYRQERRGFNGETFFIWKFRSMTVTESGRQMTQARAGDPRITRIGRFIRAKSIDELPQLFNVVRGEMSLVGPRPHALMHDDELGRQLEGYAHRQRIKPGITGWAQMNGYRGETATFAQVEGRTLHDLYYIENWSLPFDCWIILLTVFSRKARQNAV